MSETVVGSDPVDEASSRSRHPLWDRLLPPGHRFIALWLAGGAAVVSLLPAFFRPLVTAAFSLTDAVASLTSRRGLALALTRPRFLLPLAVLAVALAMWLVLRHTKAPRALALYLVASAGVQCVLNVVGALSRIPLTRYLERAMGTPLQPARAWWSGITSSPAIEVVIIVGVTAGAWLAWAMRDSRTGARTSLLDMVLGPDEDDSEEADAASASIAVPASDGWLPTTPDSGIASALGWGGWHISGANGIALGLPLVALVVGVLGVAINWIPSAYAYSRVGRADHALSVSQIAVSSAFIVLGFLIYIAIYAGAIRRFGVSPAVWLVALGASVGALVSALLFIPSQMRAGGAEVSLQLILFVQLFGLIGVFAPFLGAFIATRRGYARADSATLPAETHAPK